MKKKINTNEKYIFICLGKKDEYYFEKISIIEVLNLLFIYNKIFGQRFRINYPKYSFKWLYNLIDFKYRIIKKNFIQFIRVLKYKFRLRNDNGKLSLRHSGEYCIIVNKGYKIFNFRKKTIKKLFRSEIAERIVLRELELLKKSQNTRFAPKLIRWNIAEKWYEEELIKGNIDFSHYPRNTKSLLKNFRTSIGPALQEIMFNAPIESYSLKHIHKLYKKKITDVLSTTENIKSEIRKKIQRFTDKQVQLLNKKSNSTLFFGFTHGDFCPANIINTSNGISLIDWEGASTRSILFDFYSYIFYRPVHQIFDDFDILIEEIKLALDILIRNINSKSKKVKENITVNQDIYRRIYYIERIIMLTERINQDEKLNIKKIILDFINAFDKYEAEMNSQNSMKVLGTNY